VQYGDSDSDDSSDLLNATVDRDDEDSSSEGQAEEELVPGSDYDLDKDPAWKPTHCKSPEQSKVFIIIISVY